jgi:hypothetical protein
MRKTHMNMKYFSYDPTGYGFELHETREEAKKAANDALDYEKREAVFGGWDDNVTKICWGELKQWVVITARRPRIDEDSFISSDCDEVVEYGLSENSNGNI